MSTPVSNLREIVRSGDAILFDFDGPICHLFATYPAPVITREIHMSLIERGIYVPGEIRDQSDPLRLLTWVSSEHPNLIRLVEDELTIAERSAAKSALPTLYASEAIEAAANTNHPVAIVSNNSQAAVAQYLTDHPNIASYITVTVGRHYCRPERMKPDPYPIYEAARRLKISADRCVLIGDAITDIKAAHGAGARAVAYAKTSSRVARLTEARADVVIESMSTVTSALLRQ